MSTLRSVNLNLLPVLRELLYRRNVTRAAEALGMSQSAVSEALGRLRAHFRDDLLVPHGRTLLPTALAERLELSLTVTLGQLEGILFESAFDPATSEGVMLIATADYVVMTLAPQLFGILRKEAPRLSVQFLDVSLSSISELKLGRLDMIIVPTEVREEDFADAEREFLFEDELVCIASADTRLTEPLTPEIFEAAPHAFYCADRASLSSFEAGALQRAGLNPDELLRVNSFMLLPFLVENSDALAIIQRRLAIRLAAATRIKILQPPVPLPSVKLRAYWSRARTRDPMHRWFREQVVRAAQSIGSADGY